MAAGGTCIQNSMTPADSGMSISACVELAPSNAQDCDGNQGLTCCLSF
jgi:hypothetical protein